MLAILRSAAPPLIVCSILVSGTLGRPETPQQTPQQQLIEKGYEDFARKDYKKAAGEYKKARDLDKTQAEPWLLLAMAYFELGKYKDAIANAREATKRRKEYPAAHAALARMYFNTADLTRAEEQLDIAVNQGADDGNVRSLKGDLDVLRGDFEGALQEYEKALSLARPDQDLPNLRKMADLLRSYVDFKKQPGLARRPVVLNSPRPAYTMAARQNHIEGTIKANALVDVTGRVQGVVLISRLGYGLDEQAVLAAKELKFIPAVRDGQPVPYWVHLELVFSIR